MSKTIAILGATGSVGRQAIDVALSRGYKVDLLTANRDCLAAEEAARKLLPKTVVMADFAAADELRTKLADTNIKVLSGADAICDSIAESSADNHAKEQVSNQR